MSMMNFEVIRHSHQYKIYSDHPQMGIFYMYVYDNVEKVRSQIAAIKADGYNARAVLVVKTETEYDI